MRNARIVLVLVMSCIGCTPKNSARAPSPVARSPVGEAETMQTSASPPFPPHIEELRDIACTLTAPAWPHESDGTYGRQFLRFRAGGPPFAEVWSGTDVKLVLPVGSASAGGMLALDAKGVVIRGRFEAAEMPLYPAKAFVMSGVFVANGERRVKWRSARLGAVTIAAESMPRLRSIEGEFSAERECKDVSIGSSHIADGAIGHAMHATSQSTEARKPWPWLRSGKVILSVEPAGDVAAEIDVVEPRDDRLLIHPPRVLARENGWTRIAVSTFGGVVFGWAPSEQIVSSKTEYLDLSHDCSTYLRRVRVPEPLSTACDEDVPLVAEVSGDRRLVGIIRAGVRFQQREASAGWRKIEFIDAGVGAAEGASFLVRDADVAGCSQGRPGPRARQRGVPFPGEEGLAGANLGRGFRAVTAGVDSGP